MEGISVVMYGYILDAVHQVNSQQKKRAQEEDIFEHLTRNYKLCISCCDLHMTIYTALRIAKDLGYVQEENYSYWITDADPLLESESRAVQQPSLITDVVQQSPQLSTHDAPGTLLSNQFAPEYSTIQPCKSEGSTYIQTSTPPAFCSKQPTPQYSLQISSPHTQISKSVSAQQHATPREDKHKCSHAPQLPIQSPQLRPPILKRRTAFGLNTNKQNRISKHVVIVDKPTYFSCEPRQPSMMADLGQSSRTIDPKQSSRMADPKLSARTVNPRKSRTVDPSNETDSEIVNETKNNPNRPTSNKTSTTKQVIKTGKESTNAKKNAEIIKKTRDYTSIKTRPATPAARARIKKMHTRKLKKGLKIFPAPTPTTGTASYMTAEPSKRATLLLNPKLSPAKKVPKKMTFPGVPMVAKKCLMLKKKIERKKQAHLRNVAQERLRAKVRPNLIISNFEMQSKV